MASFFIPLTGLQADSTALNTIANNLSNMSTTGYKAQTTNFSDLFSQTIGSSGSGDEIQVGSGVQVAANSTDFSTGSATSGTSTSDVELNGNGFFVVNDGGSNVYTRDGAFTQSSTGNLVTSDGLDVMGYQAVNGVVSTTGSLTAITIPLVGQVQQPEASTSFSMTANLDSTATVGTSYPATITVYDSQGVGYQATVTYTKTATNTWSYNVALPDTLTSAATAAATATVMPVSSVAGTASTETLAATATTGAGSTTFTLNTGGTVDPSTNLTITGTTAGGVTATTTAPTLTTGETLAEYAAALTTAIGSTGANLSGVTVSTSGNTLTISGTGLTINNGITQDLPTTVTNYDFGSTATVDPTTNFTITGQDATGATKTITAPTVTAGETVAQYAAALQTAVNGTGGAGIVGVTVASTGGQITVTGADVTTAGSMKQGLSASTVNYSFGSNSGGTIATVDPSTDLTITGLTSSGATATITAPTVTSGETLATYTTALNSALATAGIGGVTVTSTAAGQLSITGANLSTSGKVIQDAVGSANTSGTLTFNASGDLVSPAADVTGITFAGLSDGAANLNLTWNVLGTSGSSTISQEDTASTDSSAIANGYAAGTYESFTISSDGTVTASYTNGQNTAIGQLALANVANLQGLSSIGNSEYATTVASGVATVGVSGTNGLGTMTDSSLEASNVNISSEFSDLIIAQRAFEANAKSITTFDTVTEDTIQMVH
jgi:flagellar hook protein FlgE